MLRVLFAAFVLVATTIASLAQTDDERAKELFNQLRCVVCQNQSIADSEAGVARDLRHLVREQIAAGKTDGEIIDFLVERYGEFVLLKPRFSARTLILWLSPLMVALFGIFLIMRMRATPKKGVAPLAPEEEARLAALVETQEGPKPER